MKGGISFLNRHSMYNWFISQFVLCSIIWMYHNFLDCAPLMDIVTLLNSVALNAHIYIYQLELGFSKIPRSGIIGSWLLDSEGPKGQIS